jgi:hypothetical protein
MRNVITTERWGLGSAGFVSPAFKGGWGPEPGGSYVVRQTGIVGNGSAAAAAAIVTRPPSFQIGTSVLTRIAGWLHEELTIGPSESPHCAR